MTIWQRLIADLKERFLKFETPLGMFLVAGGVFGIWITFTHLQYVLQAFGVLGFGTAIIYGLYAVLHNPIAKAVDIKIMTQDHIVRNDISALMPGAPEAPPSTNVTTIGAANANLVSK